MSGSKAAAIIADWPDVLMPRGRGRSATSARASAGKERLDPNNKADRMRLAHAMTFVDAADRDTWVRVGYILARLYNWTDEGFNVFNEWAATANNYSEKESRKIYHLDSKNPAPDTPQTTGYIFHLAKQHKNYVPWKPEVPLQDQDHYRLARAVVEAVHTESGQSPVYAEGSLWTVGADSLWRPSSLDDVALRVGRTYGGGKYCRRNADFKAISQLATTMVGDEAFFQNAVVGIACPSGFWRVTAKGDIRREALTADHRQRFVVGADPDPKHPPKRLLGMLHDAFKGQEPDAQISLLQELSGAALTGSLYLYRIVGLLLGETSSGKSTFLSVLASVFPRDQIAATSPTRWANEYYVAGLASKRLNVVGELDAKDPIPSGAFKAVTGRDVIEGRHPTHRPFSFVCQAAHFFNSNRTPPTADHSDAFFRRWRIVRFANAVKPGNEIRDLDSQIIQKELGGFLWWALNGAAAIAKRGEILETETHRKELARWRVENNSALSFVRDPDECVLVATAKTPGQRLYDVYRNWCAVNGLRFFGRNGFYDALRAGGASLGVVVVEHAHQTSVEGVGLVHG